MQLNMQKISYCQGTEYQPRIEEISHKKINDSKQRKKCLGFSDAHTQMKIKVR